MRFVMDLHIEPEHFHEVEEVDFNCARHISVVNDIYSWEKEQRKALLCEAEGSLLCSSVKVLSEECGLDANASKRVLWSMCREWELVHLSWLQRLEHANSDMKVYCRGLSHQMSGNELWSQTTDRYTQ